MRPLENACLYIKTYEVHNYVLFLEHLEEFDDPSYEIY